MYPKYMIMMGMKFDEGRELGRIGGIPIFSAKPASKGQWVLDKLHSLVETIGISTFCVRKRRGERIANHAFAQNRAYSESPSHQFPSQTLDPRKVIPQGRIGVQINGSRDDQSAAPIHAEQISAVFPLHSRQSEHISGADFCRRPPCQTHEPVVK